MKYLAFFLIIIVLNALSYEGHSTVVYLQSSKGKNLKISKVKKAKIVKQCPSNVKKKITWAHTEMKAQNGGSSTRILDGQVK